MPSSGPGWRRAWQQRGTLRRSDWQLTWNPVLEGGRLVISEEARIEIDGALVREPDKPAEAPRPADPAQHCPRPGHPYRCHSRARRPSRRRDHGLGGHRQTSANWQCRMLAALKPRLGREHALAAMLERYLECAATDQPVTPGRPAADQPPFDDLVRRTGRWWPPARICLPRS
jgi:hypothetical protein